MIAINDSCLFAFLALDGLEPLVANELIDGNNHNILSQASKEIGMIFNELFKIDSKILHKNVVCFYSYRIQIRLSLVAELVSKVF